MAFRSTLAAAVIGLCLVPAAAIAETKLDGLLEPIRVKYGLPALAGAVVKDGVIVATGAVGTRVLGANIPVSVDDRFHIGSDTKAMTATLAAKLIDEGRLTWTTTVGDVLGPVIPDLTPGFKAITVEQLLSHTSGLPTDDQELVELYFGNAYDDTLTQYRLKIIRQWGTKHEPGEKTFHYSNFGFITVGAMLEQITGRPWENLIQTEIFEPLGLKTAGLGPQATMGLYDAPVGHFIDENGKATPRPWGPSADAPAPMGPAGIAHMSIGDFAIWAGWNAGEGKRGPAIIKPETLKLLHTPRISMEIPNPKPGTPKSGGYGLGWGLGKFDWFPTQLINHTGSNGMNLALILINPEIDFGITVATNYPGTKADAALFELVELLYKQFAPGGANP